MATRVWYGRDGADYFMNSERMDVTLMSSFAGNDTLINAKSGVWIDAGTDNNLVSLAATGGVSIVSGSGKDTVEVATADNARYYNYINISGGSNYINNSNILHSTIKAGTGSDSIITGGYYASILASGGHNRITVTTSDGNNTITAGDGNNYVSITGASGNNVIRVGNGKNTVKGGSGNGSTVTAGDGNSYVTIGGGLVSLGNAVTGSKISLSSYGSASVFSGNGNDTLNVAKASNARYYNVIDMGEGDNYINNNNILHSTISAGTGSDTIKSGGYYASIIAGDGNNRVSLTTSDGNNTITAGRGNNYVSIKGASGNNVISLGAGDNTVKGGSGNGSTVTAGDGNSLVTVGGGLVSLGSGTGNRVSIGSYGSASVFSGNGNDTLNVAKASNARYYNFISVSGGSNRINNSNILQSTIKAGSGSDTIITGGYFSSISAGNGNNRITVSTADGNNTIVAGTGKDLVSIAGASERNYINVGKGNNTVYGGLGGSNSVLASSGNSRVTIGGGLVSLGSGKGNEVSLNGNYGSSSVKSGTGNDTINVSDSDEARYYNFISVSGGNNLISNSNILHSTIKAGTGSDTITSGGYFASILAGGGHNRISLTSAEGNNTITAASGNDYVSIKGASGSNVIRVGNGKNTVKGGSGNGSTVLAGNGNNYVTIGGGLVSLGNGTGNRVSLSSYGSASVFSGSGNDTLNVAKASNARYYNFIDMGEGNNRINNSNILHSTIKAGAGNDTIITGGYFASIDAGDGDNLISLTTAEGNNTIITGAGNDTILGNASDNLFVYAGGKDLLGESATGSKISLAAGDGASNLTDINGIAFDSLGSAVLTFNDDADNTLTIQNAAGLKIVINGTSRVLGENAFYSEDQQSVTLTAAYTGEIDASKFTNFSAAALGWPVALLGNVLSNKLVGGTGNDTLYGVAGNDTLNGGAGDDELWGGAGSDTFLYMANTGNDTIGDYERVDVLQILKEDGAAGGTFTDSAYSSGKLTLTIDGGGSVIFNNVKTSTTFNINKDAYTISGKALVKK